MMSNPTEDEICQVIEITGLDINYDRDLIIQALKVSMLRIWPLPQVLSVLTLVPCLAEQLTVDRNGH